MTELALASLQRRVKGMHSLWYEATATMGAGMAVPPWDPRKLASPKANTPPSVATNQ